MNYNNDDKNRIRRRKVNSSNSDLKPFSDINNKVQERKNNNIKRNSARISSKNNNKKQNINKSNARNNKKRLKKKKVRLNIVKKFLVVMLVALVICSVVGSAFVFTALKDSPKVTKEILEMNYISSEVVSKDEIPKYLKDAIVSIEDERFYKHNGVDIKSLIRSVVHNIFTDTTQGGSTIEMQISKNLLTDDDKTIKRKINDIFNATSMNKSMSKDDILAVYLNNIYLGRSSYGVAKGSRAYFNKNLDELSLAECAMLAGITNSPARYSEYKEAKKRQETILYKMHELGYINEEEYKEALLEDVVFK